MPLAGLLASPNPSITTGVANMFVVCAGVAIGISSLVLFPKVTLFIGNIVLKGLAATVLLTAAYVAVRLAIG
jgi:hypothetical protein